MSTPFATLALAVDIVRTAPHMMEARHHGTGQLLGTAQRSRGRDEWTGWLVQVGTHREILISSEVAATVLLYLASRLTEASDRPVTP